MTTPVPEALPTAYEYGRVIGRFLRAVGDGEDVDAVPEAVPATGTVTFTPIVTSRILIDASAEPSPLITHEPITCELDAYGHIARNGVRGVWLWTGEWTVSFNVSGMSRTPFPILVSTAHTDIAPLDLWEAAPYNPPAGATVTTMMVPSNPTDGYTLVWSVASGGLVWGPALGGIDAEGVQDIVGAMVAAAGGTYDDAAGSIILPAGGAVDSVNGQTGAVTLDAGDVGAQPAGSYAAATHTHASTSITDWAEAVQDTVAAMLTSGSNVTLSYNDAAGTLSVTAAGGDAEVMRDTLGAALVGINGVTVTINDALDTITLAVTGLTIAQVTGLQGALDGKAAALGTNDNYVTDAEKAELHTHTNKAALDLVQGTNTGDQDLSSYYTETEADARFAPAVQTVNAQTASYTLVAGDAGKLVTMTLSTAGDLTVPANVIAVPAGTVSRVDVLDLGTARMTFVAGSGMTLTGAPSLVSSARYAGFSVIFTSATTATVVGALASA